MDRTSAKRAVSSAGIGATTARFLVFYSKVVHFPADAYDWRGTCKPIAHDENGYRGE
jgi:hypothetical protein